MSVSARVRAECACTDPASWIEFRFVTAPTYADHSRIYGATSEGMKGGPYLVDKNRPVTLPDGNDMPAEGFHLQAAHGRWRIECIRCERLIVARSVKLARALVLLEATDRRRLTLDELEALLSDPRLKG